MLKSTCLIEYTRFRESETLFCAVCLSNGSRGDVMPLAWVLVTDGTAGLSCMLVVTQR